MKALVNKIIPFSSVDGPGNRTAIFLQGCNFDCLYCHNPETRNLCENCGVCVKHCPAGALTCEDGIVRYDWQKCCGCDTCIKVCSKGASPKIREMSAQEVFWEVKKQIPYIRGITVSGGECTNYKEFLEELFSICRAHGLSTFIDSNGGLLDFEKEHNLLSVTDGVMLDVKAFSDDEHRKVTGCGNELVLKNAVILAKMGKLYEVRTVVVPELFDVHDTVKKTAELLLPYQKYGDIRYKLIAFRPNGVRREYAHFSVPERMYLEELESIVKSVGFHNIILL